MSTPRTSSDHVIDEMSPQSATTAALLALETAGSLQQQHSAFLLTGLEMTVSALQNTQEQHLRSEKMLQLQKRWPCIAPLSRSGS